MGIVLDRPCNQITDELYKSTSAGAIFPQSKQTENLTISSM
jgi:hypothetical protein